MTALAFIVGAITFGTTIAFTAIAIQAEIEEKKEDKLCQKLTKRNGIHGS